jgi:hypothetical protein
MRELAIERAASSMHRSTLFFGVFAVIAMSEVDDETGYPRWTCIVRRDRGPTRHECLYSSAGFRSEEGALRAGQAALLALRDDLLAALPQRESRTRDVELADAVAARARTLASLTIVELIDRAERAGLDPIAAADRAFSDPTISNPRAAIVEALARHEAAQELTTRWLEEDMAAADAEPTR